MDTNEDVVLLPLLEPVADPLPVVLPVPDEPLVFPDPEEEPDCAPDCVAVGVGPSSLSVADADVMVVAVLPCSLEYDRSYVVVAGARTSRGSAISRFATLKGCHADATADEANRSAGATKAVGRMATTVCDCRLRRAVGHGSTCVSARQDACCVPQWIRWEFSASLTAVRCFRSLYRRLEANGQLS